MNIIYDRGKVGRSYQPILNKQSLYRYMYNKYVARQAVGHISWRMQGERRGVVDLEGSDN